MRKQIKEMIAISTMVYFTYCEIRANVLAKLRFRNNEKCQIDNMKFEKYYPKK